MTGESVRMPRALYVLFKAQTGLLVALLLWIVVVEGVLRIVPVPGLRPKDLDPPELHRPELLRNSPHPYVAYAPTPNWRTPKWAKRQASHNSLGFRGPEIALVKPEGTLRIACLGGSSTYGHTPSSDEHTWPARLQAHLREARPDLAIEVVNGGCSGYSTFESLGNYAFRVSPLRPDIVLVYHSINDVRCALYPHPKPDNTHWRAVWTRWKPSPLEPLLEKSRTYLIFRRYCTDYIEQMRDQAGVVIVDYDPDKDRYARTIEDLTGFVNAYRNLHHLVAMAKADGVRIALITQGLDERDIQGPSRAAQLAGMIRMRHVLEKVAEREGVPLIDAESVLEGEMRRQLSRDGEQRIFTHEVHLTDEGADLLARTVAGELLRLGWIDGGEGAPLEAAAAQRGAK